MNKKKKGRPYNEYKINLDFVKSFLLNNGIEDNHINWTIDLYNLERINYLEATKIIDKRIEIHIKEGRIDL